MSFLTDTFTDTNGTAMTSHTSDSGATWSNMNFLATNTAQISGNTMIGVGAYMSSATPASADYYVEGTLHIVANGSLDFDLIARAQGASGAAFYELHYYYGWGGSGTGGFHLRYYNGSAFSDLATLDYAVTSFTNGSDYTIRLKVSGTAISGYVTDVNTPIITATDSTIATAGKPGISLAMTSVSGYWLDMNATDLTTASAKRLLTLGAG